MNNNIQTPSTSKEETLTDKELENFLLRGNLKDANENIIAEAEGTDTDATASDTPFLSKLLVFIGVIFSLGGSIGSIVLFSIKGWYGAVGLFSTVAVSVLYFALAYIIAILYAIKNKI